MVSPMLAHGWCKDENGATVFGKPEVCVTCSKEIHGEYTKADCVRERKEREQFLADMAAQKQAKEKQQKDAEASLIAEYASHPKTPKEWRPRIGDSSEAVAKANRWANRVDNYPWGGVYQINKTTTPHGVHEQWVFGSGTDRAYLYFDNGILTAIQE